LNRYDLPEIVAGVLRERLVVGDTCKCPFHHSEKIRILDTGAGDGLSGVALREVGLDEASTYIAGSDISPQMLKIAKERKCYDEIEVVDLNKKPLPYCNNEFDIVTCTGTMTYVDPKSEVLEEFVRITKVGGFVCYTNRTDKLKEWKEAEREAIKKGLWLLEYESEPIPYLPLNKEYGEDIKVVVKLWKVLSTKEVHTGRISNVIR